MKELYELKDRLVDALKDYGKTELTSTNLEKIDTLAHAAKNVCKVIESEEDGNSGYYPHDARIYHGSYRGSYRRDSMGRYSREGLADKLRDLMDEAPDEKTRTDIQRMIEKM